jgi:glutaredoxin 3
MMQKITLFFLLIGTFGLSAQVSSVIAKSQKSSQNTCIVYGSNTCHHCIETKKFLSSQGVSFDFYDIDEDTVALRKMLSELHKRGISTKNLGIPVVFFKEEVFMNNIPFEQFLDKLKIIK